MNEIRAFIAIEIPVTIKDAIRELQEKFRQVRSDIKWVKVQNIHITLKFLGDVRRTQLDDIAKAVERAAVDFSAFSIHVKGVGTFPHISRPRIMWVGAETEQGQLVNLARAVNHTLASVGFEIDQKPYKAHLTLGRVKGMKGVDRVMERFSQNHDFDAGKFTASSIIVMQSDLKPTGAVYTPLRNIELK